MMEFSESFGLAPRTSTSCTPMLPRLSRSGELSSSEESESSSMGLCAPPKCVLVEWWWSIALRTSALSGESLGLWCGLMNLLACRKSEPRAIELSTFQLAGLVSCGVRRKKRTLAPSCIWTMANTSGARWRTRMAVRNVWQSAICRSLRFITGGEKMMVVRAHSMPAKIKSSASNSVPSTRLIESSSFASKGKSFCCHSPSCAGIDGMLPHKTTTCTCVTTVRICSAHSTDCEMDPHSSTWCCGGDQLGVVSLDLRRCERREARPCGVPL
mmetsp:Transcript_41720/g.103656  ORF Transcript_41720/g.103656 Transcript_41720/m.103656 type:complete len:270 (-) Transcript_41720:13-822(-)